VVRVGVGCRGGAPAGGVRGAGRGARGGGGGGGGRQSDSLSPQKSELLGNIICGLGIARRRGIDLHRRQGHEMRDGDSNLESGIVLKQIRINASVQIGKRGGKTELIGRTRLRRRRSALDCSGI